MGLACAVAPPLAVPFHSCLACGGWGSSSAVTCRQHSMEAFPTGGIIGNQTLTVKGDKMNGSELVEALSSRWSYGLLPISGEALGFGLLLGGEGHHGSLRQRVDSAGENPSPPLPLPLQLVLPLLCSWTLPSKTTTTCIW